MADKIKSFFHKMVVDTKFINAGKGHRLTETASSNVASTSTVEPRKRVEPTAEARTAGQAALARLETKDKKNEKKFNTSYAAIKAQVQRELEQEMRAQREAHARSKERVEEEATVKDTSLLAVANVCYRCPFLSDEVLPRDEWKMKIKEFLYEQLKGEDAALVSCLIIQNCNDKREKVEACVETLGKYLENIINNPEEEKYKKIRMQNRIFQERVVPVNGASEFLNAAGFQPTKLLNNDDKEEDFLVWSSDSCSMDDLTTLLEALKTAEPMPLELDRNLQVLLPMQASKRTELPPSFYNLKPEDIKREQQLRTEACEKNQMLRTRKMRERDKEQERKKYKFALIRVKFPDNLILQGTFSVHENFQSVVDFVTENLVCNDKPFCLRQLPDTTFNKDSFDKTLLDLGLFPAALLMFVWADASRQQQQQQQGKCNESSGYLKEELLSVIQPA
ncbi:UBX domain-containing protein 6 [Ceratina calcarata]|uniref:UBX domain-containing protein 6 n=1 Tax=Ceratina calcarata TaxID=156304 RepID=A0AAJ7SBH0_9HYME|nr:UBX domain-containing protein 6 [Ceratina calcarata]XP_026674878.1 UBX domain-containing protein 6 [Ceratina calcarata]XP_026674879.1 UBX domain-containing protein 6 [Ceratina calcarata]